MKKKLLITGGTGFLGSSFVERYNEKYDIFVISRLHSNVGIHKLKNIKKLENLCQLSDVSQIGEIFQKYQIDGVLHFAANIEKNVLPEHYVEMAQDNIIFGVEILKHMKLHGCNKILYASAGLQQAKGKKDYNPANLSAATKQAFEDILQYFYEKENFSTIKLVFPLTYGINDTQPRVFNTLKEVLIKGLKEFDMTLCEQTVYFVHISDIVNAIEISTQILLEEKVRDEKYYAFGEGMALKDAVKTFLDVVDEKRQLKVNFGGLSYPKEMIPAPYIGKIVPDWKPKISLQKGLLEFK